MFHIGSVFFLLFLLIGVNSSIEQEVCRPIDIFLSFAVDTSAPKGYEQNRTIYILYDVNPGEGFNLRRDVYIRMAVFIRDLNNNRKSHNYKLVLPPFRRLYHWRSSLLQQNNIFWNHFFDMDSLQKFAPVIDFFEFMNEIHHDEEIEIDQVYKLMHFEEMFTDGVFVDRFEFFDCFKVDFHPGLYLQYENVTEKNFTCLKFQGSSKLLQDVVHKTEKHISTWPTSILFLNAEIVLHDHWSNDEFWRARRSMRFNKNLVSIANKYRYEKFNSTDEYDMVQRPEDWRMEKPYRGAKGGEYICVHLRRADFLYSREKVLPTLKSAANQIKAKMKDLDIDKLFISSDCNRFEYKNLKAYLGRVDAYRFDPESLEQKAEIKDGGIAIVDQIICSHARYFIGTYESTFTYRIYEEREILGFPKEATFNTLCKNEDLTNCQKNSIWPIVY